MTERDTEKNDKHLATMAETEGWNVFVEIAQDMMAELLESPEFSDETPGDVRLAIYESRAFATDTIRKLIKVVESTKSAKRIEHIENSTEEYPSV